MITRVADLTSHRRRISLASRDVLQTLLDKTDYILLLGSLQILWGSLALDSRMNFLYAHMCIRGHVRELCAAEDPGVVFCFFGARRAGAIFIANSNNPRLCVADR